MDTGTATHLLAATPHHHIGQAIRDWTLAASAAIAAVGAGAAAVIAALAYRQQAADRHREHASKFSVWITVKNYNQGAIRVHRMVAGRVLNSSDEPMYRVVVVFRHADDPTKTIHTGRAIRVLPPHDTRDVSVDLPAGVEPAGVVAEAGFDDRAGVHWYRDWQGRLVEQPQHSVS